MFTRIIKSWGMTKASWTVLMENKQLLLFPILSMMGVIMLALIYLPALYFSSLFAGINSGDANSMIIGGVLLFSFYLISYVLVFYCNCALVGIVLMRIKGGNPTLHDGFQIANNHLKVIFQYSMIAATVGVILQWLSERGTIGDLVGAVFGIAWNLATFLIVPILVSENIGPIDALKRSARLLKDTWGETIIGNAGIGLVFIILMSATFFSGVMLITLLSNSPLIIFTIIGAVVLIMIVLALISAALTSVYRTAVYHYATGGTVGIYFNESQIKEAFRLKNKS